MDDKIIESIKDVDKMKKLNIDLDLLFQSFSFEDDGLCKEYLDTETGDIINISNEVSKVIDGQAAEESLEDWEKEILRDAYAVSEDKSNRYILIPKIEASYFEAFIEEFIKERITSELLQRRLQKALSEVNTMRNFKNVLSDYPEELDLWYDFEEEKGKEYVEEWLMERGIEVL
jgi:hypothetical protein